ncbi:hypothetical protein HH310_25605, partial [Actinoplanes sp. TBRC 11911]|uniref:hypothetical protein n=1 Tax=Actinoplanes sp. TBRC 11911 TaxID=2729386 RepID=UPI00145DF91D
MAEPYLGSLTPPGVMISGHGVHRLQDPTGIRAAEIEGRLRAQIADAQQRIPELLSEIADITASADPLTLYSQSQVVADLIRSAHPGAAGFGIEALTEFYGGLVTAMPEHDVLDRLGRDFAPKLLYLVAGLLREYGTAEHQLQQSRIIMDHQEDSLTRARRFLEFEHRFDRMTGYPVQLRQIFNAVVGSLAGRSIKQLGYALSDALTAADAYHAVLKQRSDVIRSQLGVTGDGLVLPDNPGERLLTLFASRAHVAASVAAPLEDDLPGLLAERTGLPRERLTAVLKALATPLGSQPELQTLGDTNALRRRPVIGLPDGRYLWPRPGDFSQVALDWAADVCQLDDDL